MGLDVYVGPLSRYYSGDWETIFQQMGRQSGMNVEVIRLAPPGNGVLSRLLRFFTRSTQPRDLSTTIASWQASLSRYAPGGVALDWRDSPDGAYYTDKPGWDCYGALVLWAAYEQLNPRERLSAATDQWSHDPAYLATLADPSFKYRHLVANTEVWLPGEFDPPFEAPMPVGNPVTIGSSPRLLAELLALNENTWQAGPSDFELWCQEGAEYGGPLETSARLGFAIFHKLASKSVELRLPMKLDY